MQDQTIKIKNQLDNPIYDCNTKFLIFTKYCSSNNHILSITLPMAINQYAIVRQEDLK